jgi:signal transduction histidine kinase
MSHEIRTPMNGILALQNFRNQSYWRKQQEYIRVIEKEQQNA